MAVTSGVVRMSKDIGAFATGGVFWLVVALLGAGVFFWEGIEELLVNWQAPEYSHGPLIPVLSALLSCASSRRSPSIGGR